MGISSKNKKQKAKGIKKIWFYIVTFAEDVMDKII